MEAGTSGVQIGEESKNLTWKILIKEVKKVSLLAAPMITVSILQYMVQVVALMMVGHLGELPLASVAIAISITNVTGFSLLIGLCGGLDTLCGQAFGAKQYKKIATYVYSAIICLLVICIPIILVWIFMDKLLILVGQDPEISMEARKFSVWLIPGLIASAIYNPLVRFLQCQSLTLPLLLNFVAVLGINTLSCWISVYKLEFGIQAVAFSLSLCSWLNVIFLGIYINFSSACERTRPYFSKDVFYNIWLFLKFGFPAALMTCLKWWAFEAVTLLSGRLPNPQLETSVLSICLNISTLFFTVPLGLGYTVGIRVSNELGAGNAEAARLSAWVVTTAVFMETLVASVILFCGRHIVGYAYSHTKQVVTYVADVIPFLCLSIITDGLQMVLSGIAKGSGWQRLGAYVNLGAFYLVGLPVAIVLGFVRHLNAKGLWIGILIGSILQATLLIIVTILTNWRKQATKAIERSSEGTGEQRVDGTQ
ncbi:protein DETOXIFICATION 1 [Beta vulgaris subsp. vulgaris]|uniref:protein DETOXIFICATION 1 n=1 Tax=Beta vulgaris subsp. vulgaris TaxID=3555 RepID=UPI00203706EA|nr:protein DETOXIFICATION 1 [Beta vulgaris subsp. vulgaris]XP_010683280.2 protein DETOXIFICATION 1 [Beta vulgaris subsp. vulgaris]